MVEPVPVGRGGLIPHLVCENCAAAIDFYKKALGAEETFRLPAPDGTRLMHAEIRVGETIVMLADDFPEHCGGVSRSPKALGATPVGLQRYVEDCDAAFNRAVEAGATPVMPPQDMFWGDRYGMVVDPFGHQWSFATKVATPTPEELEAGARECFQRPAN